MTTIAARLGNALITGGITVLLDRYQTRLVWLLTVYAIVRLCGCGPRHARGLKVG